jgi:hypothetical protein
MGVKLRAWLIPVSSDQSRRDVVPPQLLAAWTATLREWDWQSPATRERNVRTILSHYHVKEEVVAELPPGLVRDWSKEGRPEPSTWIEAKLEAIVAEDEHRSVA